MTHIETIATETGSTDTELAGSRVDSTPANCPICGAASHERFKKYGYSIVDCSQCSHRFVTLDSTTAHIASVYGDTYFQGGHDGYFDYLSESQLLRSHGQRYGRILKRYMPPGAVLDVGAAAGFVLQGLVDEGWSGRGIEPNESMANYARTQLRLEVQTGSLEQFSTDERFDLINMVQVIPHLHDLRTALRIASELTKPSGYWLIETWNRESRTARVFGQQWHEYSPPSVLHWFSPGDLSNLAAQYGFQKVASGRPGKWINGGHVKSLLRYKLGDSRMGKLLKPMLSVIPDGLNLPYPAEDLFWTLFQKNS